LFESVSLFSVHKSTKTEHQLKLVKKFIAVTVTMCNILQQNYRSTCKLHLNYKLYNTLNIKTNKSTQRAQTTTTVILDQSRKSYLAIWRNLTGIFSLIDTQVIKFRQISDISYFFQNMWAKI